MTLADLSDQISPFPHADNLLSADHHRRTSSSPLRKLQPIRSHTNGSTNGGGDSPNSSSAPPPEKLSRGTSSTTTTLSVSPSSDGDDSIDMDANQNPTQEPLWSKTLEQIGYMQRIEDDNIYKQLLNQRNGNGDATVLLPSLSQFSTFLQAPPVFDENPSNNTNNNNIPPPPDPVEIANMLVSLHTTSTPDDDEEAVQTSDGNRKRKRKTYTDVELFLINMVDQVTKQQEQMHKQLMEIIDKHDQERIAREEAWRKQEVERQRKDKELRDQQTARNLALISFIEDYLGQKFHFPGPLVVPKDEHRNDQGLEVQEYKLDLSSKRWPQSEVKSLITIRIAMDHKFRNTDLKHNIWEEVSQSMIAMGYNRNAKKCKEKWENINKYFKKTVASGKRPKSNKTCPYFDELDVLYRTRILNPGSTSVEVKNADIAEIEAEKPQSF